MAHAAEEPTAEPTATASQDPTADPTPSVNPVIAEYDGRGINLAES
ncbi:hypothetical protein [Streptomyces sp. UG1]